MKKLMIPVFLVFVGAMILISAWPTIVDSRKPVNMFIAKAKADGYLPLIQIVTSDEEAQTAQAEVEKFNAMSGLKLALGAFPANENADIIQHYKIQAPGYIILDADGKAAIQENGVINALELAKKAGNVHTH